MQDLKLITRELLNEILTPEEEREWMTYTAYLPKQEVEEAREHLVSASVIVRAMVRLMSEGATPDSEAVQKLLLQNNRLTLRYRLRERLITRGNWNQGVTRKVHTFGMRLVMKLALPPDGSVSEGQVMGFCSQAHRASTWGQALDEIAEEAAALADRNAGAHSNAAQALAERYTGVCKDFSLGEPVLYGRWFIEFGRMLADNAWVPVNERYRGAWTLLIEAVESSRRPAGLRAAAAW